MSECFILLPESSKEECESWVRLTVKRLRERVGDEAVNHFTHHYLRETWANGYLARKQDEEDGLHVQDEEE